VPFYCVEALNNSIRVWYAEKVRGTGNSASDVGTGAIPVRLFLLNNLTFRYIESAIDRNLKEEIFIRKENKMAYRQNNSQGRNDRIRFDLMERIGVLSRKDNGWTREVNIVAWNDGPGKVDIREWDPDHKRMTRGVTLFEEEAEKLTKVLARRYGLMFQEDAQDRSFIDDRAGYMERAAADLPPQGRSFGELTESPAERSYGGQASVAESGEQMELTATAMA